MGQQRPNFDDEWAGWEPAPPQRTRWGLWLGLVVVGLLVVGACLVGSYLVVMRQVDSEPEIAAPPIVVPTSPLSPTFTAAAEQTAVVVTPPAASLTPTLPVVAPTLPLPGGTAVATVAPPADGGRVSAIRLANPPAIDGNLAEWDDTPTYESAYRVYSAPGWNGTDDVTAVWRLAWDDNNLYIAVVVTDDTHVQTQTGNLIFRGDSVDMQFETNRARGSSRLGPSNYQITFSPGDFAMLPPSAFRFQGTAEGQILDAPGGHRVTVAAQRTADGYTLEASVPWSDLNLTPAPGLVLGVALNVNDNDGPGTAVQEVMKSHVPNRTLTNPTTWGTLRLE
jgi:hypothetical protein